MKHKKCYMLLIICVLTVALLIIRAKSQENHFQMFSTVFCEGISFDNSENSLTYRIQSQRSHTSWIKTTKLADNLKMEQGVDRIIGVSILFDIPEFKKAPGKVDIDKIMEDFLLGDDIDEHAVIIQISYVAETEMK